jgi:hypothetical protein
LDTNQHMLSPQECFQVVTQNGTNATRTIRGFSKNSGHSCLTLTSESSSGLEKDIAFRKSIASADQFFKAVDVSVSLVSPIKSNMSVLKEFKLAEVCVLSSARIVRSENTTISYRTLLDYGISPILVSPLREIRILYLEMS